MTRFATLLALGAIPGSCSPAQPAGNSATTANIAAASIDGGSEPSMSETRIWIASNRGQVTAVLVDNDATRALVRMLPLTIEMRDHLRQEKAGTLPALLPDLQRQTEFSAGTLGLWGNDDFVIYYRGGHVPPPGIIILGRVTGDVSILDRPGNVTVRLQRAD